MNLDEAARLALDTLPMDARSRFAQDPLNVLQRDLGLTVRQVDHLSRFRADGGACDGMSFLEEGVILYSPSLQSRRENFTLAHEFGHVLVDRLDALYDWLAGQDHAAQVLETLCDEIAQRLLMPTGLVDTIVGSGPVRAQHLVDLYRTSQGSRPVCGIALADHLTGLGAVVLVDRWTQTVAHASVRPDPDQGWPTVFPWRGQPVPAHHPLALMQPGTTTTRKTFWRDSWGRQQDYYMDASAVDERRAVAIFAADDLWNAERLHLDSPRAFDQRPTTQIHCCGETRTVRGWRCPTCGEPDCPVCRSCRCGRQAQREQLCSGCHLWKLPHLFVDGLCDECR